MTNQEIAELLRKVAAAYTVKDKEKYKFQIIAYEQAAVSIENSVNEVKNLWKNKNLHRLPGVGKAMAHYLDELLRTGKVEHFEKIIASLPKAMFVLLDLPGIGPKSAYKLSKALGITHPHSALTKLKKAAEKGRIREIEGFGEESEKEILKEIKKLEEKTPQRLLLPYAWQIAKDIIHYLQKCPQVKQIYPLGSLRRMSATVGDIDIAVATDDAKTVINYFNNYPQAKELIAAGANTARLIHQSGVQIDLKTEKLEAFGALLQHFTGSKEHNIKLRELGLKKGLSLSEHGMKKIKKAKFKITKFKNEYDFYHALGMEWIPPELREDKGEIEAALAGKLPELIELSDIRGDLHIHSNFPIETSHDEGQNSMEEMIKMAGILKYQYLVFSEHNPSRSKHTDEGIIELLKRKREIIEQINYTNFEHKNCSNFHSEKRIHKVFAFNSLEVDIRPNGDWSIPEKGFDYLDFAVVSIHSSFKLSQKEMTKRILRGLSHPKVKILAHPTGRMLSYREGYEIDWEELFDFCLKNDKWLEINAWPDRLDLPDVLVREAIKRGVKITIGTDSHVLWQMELIKYGVAVAKRGWAEKKDIINTLSFKDFYDRIEKN